jgi:hypothetical protein
MSEFDQGVTELWAGVVDEALVKSVVFNQEALNTAIYDAKPQHVKAVRTACLDILDEVMKNITARREAAQSACDAELKRQYEAMEELRNELGFAGKGKARAKEDKKKDEPETTRRSNGHAVQSASLAEAKLPEVIG